MNSSSLVCLSALQNKCVFSWINLQLLPHLFHEDKEVPKIADKKNQIWDLMRIRISKSEIKTIRPTHGVITLLFFSSQDSYLDIGGESWYNRYHLTKTDHVLFLLTAPPIVFSHVFAWERCRKVAPIIADENNQIWDLRKIQNPKIWDKDHQANPWGD